MTTLNLKEYERYLKNKEQIKTAQKKYYDKIKNTDKYKQNRKTYLEANKDAINTRRRERRAEKKLLAKPSLTEEVDTI